MPQTELQSAVVDTMSLESDKECTYYYCMGAGTGTHVKARGGCARSSLSLTHHRVI